MKIKSLLLVLVICIIVALGSCSNMDSIGTNSSAADVSSTTEVPEQSSAASEQSGVVDIPWEIPYDIENPSQGLELAETYSKEQGDGYVVVGIGTCTDTDIVIPSTVNGIPVVEIADRAFWHNNKITGVYCGNRVTKVGMAAFSDCKNLKKAVIPDSVVFIGECAFSGCGISELVLGNRVKECGRGAFQQCSSLKKVKLPLSLTVVTEDLFTFCTSLFEVELSPYTVSIEKQSFQNTAIKSIFLPANVKSISSNVFESDVFQGFEVNEGNPYFCSVDGVLFSKDMTTLIVFPTGKKGDYTVPDGVKLIDTSAFLNITYEVTLPDSVRSIGTKAFQGFYASSFTMNVKKGVSYIDDYAFSCPEGKVTINFEGTQEEWNAIRKAEYWYTPNGGVGHQTTTVKCSDGNLTFNYDPGY